MHISYSNVDIHIPKNIKVGDMRSVLDVVIDPETIIHVRTQSSSRSFTSCNKESCTTTENVSVERYFLPKLTKCLVQ